MHLPVVTSAAVVGIHPDRALALARSAALTADELHTLVARVRVDLEGHCTGVPSLLGSMAQWLWETSTDVARRARAASDDAVFTSGAPAAVVNDALLSFVSAGNALAVRLMVAGLSKEQLIALAKDLLRQLEAIDPSDDDRDTYRRALLPLTKRILDLAAEAGGAAYGGAEGHESADLTTLVARLMLPPKDREGSGWEAFFRGFVLGDWDRGYTTPGLESARVTGLLLGSLLPPADVRDAAAAVPNRDPLAFVLCLLSAYPAYGDALRIVSKTIQTGLKLSKAGRRVQDLATEARKLTAPVKPVSSVASNASRVRTVNGSFHRVTGGGRAAGSAIGRSGAVELSSLPREMRRGLQRVAFGQVEGTPVLAHESEPGLPKKPPTHYSRYDLADGSTIVTGKDAELFVSTDCGLTWSAVR